MGFIWYIIIGIIAGFLARIHDSGQTHQTNYRDKSFL